MTRSLVQKLGFKSGMRVLLMDAPDGYRSWLGEPTEGIEFLDQPPETGTVPAVHAFFEHKRELDAHLPFCRALIEPAGMIWISWLKKASGRSTDLGDQAIREAAFPLDLVDVKVCSVSPDWSALKLVIRKERR